MKQAFRSLQLVSLVAGCAVALGCSRGTKIPLQAERASKLHPATRLVVRASIDGVPNFLMLVDTAASKSAISPRIWRDRPVEGTTKVSVGGEEREVAVGRIARLTVGNKTMTDMPIWILEPVGKDNTTIHGVLGLDFLSQHVVTIDAQRGTMTLN